MLSKLPPEDEPRTDEPGEPKEAAIEAAEDEGQTHVTPSMLGDYLQKPAGAPDFASALAEAKAENKKLDVAGAVASLEAEGAAEARAVEAPKKEAAARKKPAAKKKAPAAKKPAARKKPAAKKKPAKKKAAAKKKPAAKKKAKKKR